MDIKSHHDKINAFECALAKLDPDSDSELLIWLRMLAATHRINAFLHGLGYTSEREGANKPGDIIHSYLPPLTVELPKEALELLQHLRFIEDLRPHFVRGDRLADTNTLKACKRAYDIICRTTTPVLKIG